MINTYYYTNEIVFAGHPDKICDQISDAILTEYLKQDLNSHCGIEVMGTKNKIIIGGEVNSTAKVEPDVIALKVLKEYNYDTSHLGIINEINTQSPDINQGVEIGGAGDQGMMFGYACDDTPQMLPTAQVILQKLAIAYDILSKTEEDFFPDGKAQITGEYDSLTHKLLKIKDFTISYSNSEKNRETADEVIKTMATQICDEYHVPIEKFHINPTGKFSIWGFEGDCGLTGRKIVCDSYQSFARVGGGAFSGKDPTKVDRSGAYYARWLAKQILKSFPDIHNITVQLSYTIGMDKPMCIYINTGDGRCFELQDVLSPEDAEKIYKEATPNGIIEKFNLKDFDYTLTSKYGHFGFQEFPWEK